MLEAIASIETYTVVSYDAFLEDEKTQDAIMFNLEQTIQCGNFRRAK